MNITELVIVFCLFINLSILLKDKLHLLYKIVFIVGISGFLQSWQELNSFIVLQKNTSLLQLLNNMKGNTGNINILAASLTIKIPFLLFGITHFKNYKKVLLILALFCVVTTILLTGARTALINLFLIFLIYFVYLLREYSFNRFTFIKILYIVIPVLISVFFSNMIFKQSKDKARFVSLENRVKAINTDDASSKTRLILWSNALKISQTSPLFGIGLGNYRIESMPYEQTTEDNFNASLHAHNDFFEILAETGVLNGLIYLSLFITVFFINLKKALKSPNNETKTIACLVLLLLIIYGVDSFFNFPMYRPTMQIFFSLMLALTVVNSSDLINQNNSKAFKIRLIYLLIGISCITSYSTMIIYKASCLEAEIIRDDINTKIKGTLIGDEVIKRMPMYPNVFLSSESFYEYAAIYYTREKNYDKALYNFAKANKISPYSGRINFYKSLISTEKGNTDSAYVYMKEAFYLRPRNLFFFKYSTNLAAAKKDTLEILKEHKLFSQYRKMSEAWSITAIGLQNAGVDQKRLIKFIDQGLKMLPNDSTLLRQKKDFLINEYITEGQIFESQSKLDKAFEAYSKALKIDSKNINALQNIGLYYFNTGQNKQAIIYFLEALKYPGLVNGKAEFYLGMSYIKVNDKENACRYFSLAKVKKFQNAALLDLYCK
ncbi:MULTISPECIES: O-antigen ligase family protein [unclassified Flavobacterium]|uniref:O-antigen ligase family protein n=1 Tax=unclassified Flavobacterium TaxID=196869 RepID=UPI001314CA68|nr:MULTISPECIES: O-antigen ligase family protein [unclassified Flavobacterium]